MKRGVHFGGGPYVYLGMTTVSQMSLSDMLAEAAAFRGETSGEDPVVARIRAASHRLAWGASEAEVAEDLVAEGATQEEAFLAVRAGGLL